MSYKQTITWSGLDAQVDTNGRLQVAISGNIVIGSVSANVDSIYIQSGANLQVDSVDSSYITSGNVVTSGTVILHGLESGTTPGAPVPLLCTAEGYLLMTATV